VGGGESTAAAAARVARARSVQLLRQGRCNARLTDLEVQRWCAVDAAARHLLEETMRQRALSGRARMRLLRLARTIADLEGADRIGAGQIAGALMLRCMDASVAPARAAGAG
jgi:magnesium chelatase family protein